MANTDTTINLDIRSSNCGSPAFPNAAVLVAGTSNPDNLTYSYQLTGGTDGKGNVDEKKGGGAVTITLNLTAANAYNLENLVFNSDSHPDVTFSVTGNHRTARIVDNAQDLEQDYYKILVADTGNAGCQFTCDPWIRNKN
jgi:hypothetical protein